MHRRVWVAAGALLAVCGIALTAGGAYAYYFDSTRTDVIAVGVQIAGIDVGGLHAAQAEQLLAARLDQRLRRPVNVVYGAHRFAIRPARARVRVEIEEMVATRRPGVAQAATSPTASSATSADSRCRRTCRCRRRSPAATSISSSTVSRASSTARRITHASSRTSAQQVFASFLQSPASRSSAPCSSGSSTAALLGFDGPSTLTVPTRSVQPRWWTSTLKRRYGTYLLVSRETFTLRLYKSLKLVKTYHIAVGRQGLETPAGEYTINDKQINPSWHVPLSSWAGSLAGQIIPPGPADPIKARWLGFFDGAGIHGTDETWSIGTAASHGCIRMTIPDVEDLYPRVPLHTPIYVG